MMGILRVISSNPHSNVKCSIDCHSTQLAVDCETFIIKLGVTCPANLLPLRLPYTSRRLSSFSATDLEFTTNATIVTVYGTFCLANFRVRFRTDVLRRYNKKISFSRFPTGCPRYYAAVAVSSAAEGIGAECRKKINTHKLWYFLPTF